MGEKIPRFFNNFSRGLSAVGGIQAGSDSRFFDPKFTPPLAIAICYEISDGLKIRKAVNSGAKLIITAANLDPYPNKLYDQFLSMAKLRSIENSKDNLLVSNTGPSGLISNGLEIRKAINSGAKLIITAANLDPYPAKLYNQFLSLARLRSIENKKNNLLVSNTGPSGLVQDDGKIIKLLDYDVEQNEILFPNFSSEKTFYTKFGDKPILFLFILFMGLNFFWKIN